MITKIVFPSIFLFTTVILLFSCTSQNNDKSQKTIKYISEILSHNDLQDNYLIVPSIVCKPCIEQTYYLLSKKNISLNVILIGGITMDSSKLKNKYPDFSIYLDRDELFYNKKNQIISTQDILFLKVNTNKIINYIKITSRNLNESLKLLQKIEE